jgi:hypothetical protein
MFGKTRDLNEIASFDGAPTDDFFGDEVAAEEAAHIDELRNRVAQVESQISSQFTSLATYAQIAQEQIELARAEAKATTERSEHRLTELIERERADRVRAVGSAGGLSVPPATATSVDRRLDVLEQNVAQIKTTLGECFAQQKALAEAINTMFDRLATSAPAVTAVDEGVVVEPVAAPRPAAFSAPVPVVSNLPAPAVPPALSPASGPIPGLSFNLQVS